MKRRPLSCLLLLGAVGAITAGACSNLEPIEEQTCGNALIEQRPDGEAEDCDSHALLGMECRPPGTVGECRFQCSAEGVCAPGYACGEDDICRAASGSFSVSTKLDGGATFLLLGDFDGDLAPDVFASSSGATRVHYLDGALNEQLELSQPLTLASTRFAIGSLTSDELDDIAYSEQVGLGVLRGSEDQTLASTAYASIPIPLARNAVIFGANALLRTVDDDTSEVSELPGQEPLAIAEIPSSATTFATVTLLARLDQSLPNDVALIGHGRYGSAEQPVPPLRNDAGRLIERVPAGPLAPSTPCEEYVLAFRQANVVLVGTPCISDDEPNGGLISGGFEPPFLREIVVDVGGLDVDEAHLFDLDQDGTLDVLVSPLVEEGESPSPARAALGPFVFALEGVHPPEHPTSEYELLTLLAGERLLELADLNGDLQPDFVTSLGVFVSEPAGPPCAMGAARIGADLSVQHCPVVEPLSSGAVPYRFAALGDFNDSGGIDIALSTGVTNALTIFNALDGAYARFTVITDGFPVELIGGDFDGDNFGDVAFVDRPCPFSDQACDGGDEAGGDPLGVSFGRAEGALEEPRIIGRLSTIEHLVPGRFRANGAAFLDGIDEVGVLSSSDVDGQRRLGFSILQGRSDRQLQSPYLVFLRDMVSEAGALLFEPGSHVVGQFVESTDAGYAAGSGQADVALVARANEGTTGLWLLASNGEAELSEATSWFTPFELPQGWDPKRGAMLSVDLDADGVDEIVYANGDETGTAGGLAVGKVAAGPDGPTILATLIEESSSLAGLQPTLGAPGSVARDLDGDGRVDVVTAGFSSEGGEPLLEVIVYWNDLEPGGDPLTALSAGSVSRLPLTGLSIFGVTSMGALNLDGDPQLELVLTGVDGARSVNLGSEDPRQLLEPVLMPDIAVGGVALEVGDLDGDGLEDLVVGYPTSHVQIYLSVPVNR